MKTLLGTLLALGLLSTAASAQYCPPGFGYGPRVGFHQPAQAAEPAAPVAAVAAAPASDTAIVAAPIEPAPAAQQPAPEAAPPK